MKNTNDFNNQTNILNNKKQKDLILQIAKFVKVQGLVSNFNQIVIILNFVTENRRLNYNSNITNAHPQIILIYIDFSLLKRRFPLICILFTKKGT